MHLGRPRVIGCWQVGDVLVDPGPESCLPTLLEALADERPRALLLTHIHLDHAGASGADRRAFAANHRPVLEVVRAKFPLDNRYDLAAVTSVFPL